MQHPPAGRLHGSWLLPGACKLCIGLTPGCRLLSLSLACSGVVGALVAQGMTPVLLTGDNWRTARAIASQLGIAEVAGERRGGSRAGRQNAAGVALAQEPWCQQAV